MDGNILVSADALENTANAFAGIMGEVENFASQMVEKVDALKSKWQGEASEAYAKRFHMLDDDIVKLKNVIDEHVKDLNLMADVYRKAERKNTEAGSALASDVLS